jgi:phosphatidylethanolamine-binding protein (PEBP) family uncharacterized protein
MGIVIAITLAEFRLNGPASTVKSRKRKFSMQLSSQSFQNGSPIPAEFAFGRIDRIHHFAFSQNRNPQLEWKDVPEPAKSFVLICHDVDVPSLPDEVNQEGCEVPLLFLVLSSFIGFSWIFPLRLDKLPLEGIATE